MSAPFKDVLIDEDVSRSFGDEFRAGDRIHVRAATKMTGKQQDVGIALSC